MCRDTNAEIQPAALRALTKIGLCLVSTKEERKPILELLVPHKKALTASKDSNVKAATIAMFAELDPPGRSVFKSLIGKK